jgi:hypothetical protein
MTSPPWVSPTPRTPVHRRRPVQLIALAAIVVVIVVVLVVVLSGGKAKNRIVGTFIVGDKQGFTTSGRSCTGTGRFAGLKSGGFVTLYGEGTSYLTSGTLDAGILNGDGTCTFNFDLGKVETSANSYTAVVAHDFHATKSKADLKAVGYSFLPQVG